MAAACKAECQATGSPYMSKIGTITVYSFISFINVLAAKEFCKRFVCRRFDSETNLSLHQGNVCMATSSAKKNVATSALGMENHGSAPSRFASSTICSTQTPNWPCQWLQVQKTSRFYVALCCFHLLSSTVSFANLCQTWMSKYVLQARHLLVSDLLVVSCSPSFGFGIHHVPIHPQAKKGANESWIGGLAPEVWQVAVKMEQTTFDDKGQPSAKERIAAV